MQVKPWIQAEQCGFCLGRGKLDQLYTLARVQKGAWEFVQADHMCFVDLGKAYNCVPQGVLWGVHREYGVDGLLLWAITFLYGLRQSLVHIAGSKSDPFPVRVGLRQGGTLSPVLFVIFMDRFSRCSNAGDGVGYGEFWILSILYTDYMDQTLTSSSHWDVMQPSVKCRK